MHGPPLPDREQETQFRADHPPRRPGADLRAAAAVRRRADRHPRTRHLGHPGPPARPASRRDDPADRRPRLLARRRELRCGTGGQGLPPRLAAPGPLQHARHAIPRRGASVPAPTGLRIDCYDNPGDYLGSGMDGLEIYVHGNAQDQLCQISKQGKLVVYGDVGQTFLYGAKGGEVYVLGNAAGRPMINAVGSPRVVINGTALDFLAESFMAGDPAQRRRLRHRQRPPVRSGRRTAPAGAPVPRQQSAFAGLRRGDLHPRSPSHAGRRATQRRGVPAPVHRRLEAHPAVPGRERTVVRHPHRSRSVDRRRNPELAASGLPQGDASRERRGRGRDGRAWRMTRGGPPGKGEHDMTQPDPMERRRPAGGSPAAQRHPGQRVLSVPQVQHGLSHRPGHGFPPQPDHAAGASGRGKRSARLAVRSGCAPRARPAPRAAPWRSTSPA